MAPSGTWQEVVANTIYMISPYPQHEAAIVGATLFQTGYTVAVASSRAGGLFESPMATAVLLAVLLLLLPPSVADSSLRLTNCPRMRGRSSARRFRLSYRTCSDTGKEIVSRWFRRRGILQQIKIIRVLGFVSSPSGRNSDSFSSRGTLRALPVAEPGYWCIHGLIAAPAGHLPCADQLQRLHWLMARGSAENAGLERNSSLMPPPWWGLKGASDRGEEGHFGEHYPAGKKI